MLGRGAAPRTVKAPDDSPQDNKASVLQLQGPKSANTLNELRRGPCAAEEWSPGQHPDVCRGRPRAQSPQERGILH